jgi:hypothetical protein
MSRRTANTPQLLDVGSLRELLLGGRNRREDNGEVIEELGFSAWLWNRARPAVGLSADVGAYPNHPGLGNSFVLTFPAPDDDGADRLSRVGTADAVFDALVGAWDPDWATWTTNSWRGAQPRRGRGPVVGWFTYVKGVGVAGLSCGVARAAWGGVLVKAGPGFADVDVDQVLALRRELERASLL